MAGVEGAAGLGVFRSKIVRSESEMMRSGENDAFACRDDGLRSKMMFSRIKMVRSDPKTPLNQHFVLEKYLANSHSTIFTSLL